MHRLQTVLEQVGRQKLVLLRRKLSSVEEFIKRFPSGEQVIVDGTERHCNRMSVQNKLILVWRYIAILFGL